MEVFEQRRDKFPHVAQWPEPKKYSGRRERGDGGGQRGPGPELLHIVLLSWLSK